MTTQIGAPLTIGCRELQKSIRPFKLKQRRDPLGRLSIWPAKVIDHDGHVMRSKRRQNAFQMFAVDLYLGLPILLRQHVQPSLGLLGMHQCRVSPDQIEARSDHPGSTLIVQFCIGLPTRKNRHPAQPVRICPQAIEQISVVRAKKTRLHKDRGLDTVRIQNTQVCLDRRLVVRMIARIRNEGAGSIPHMGMAVDPRRIHHDQVCIPTAKRLI